MVSIVLRSALLLLALWACSIGRAQSITYIPITDLPQAADHTADFKKTSDAVNRHYTHLGPKGIDGGLLQRRYLELVRQARTNLEYGDILVRYFAELRNSHSNVLFKAYHKDCSASLVEGRVFLAHVGDSAFTSRGIQEKDEIVRIDDLPVSAYLQERAKYVSASTDLHRTYLTVSSLFSSYHEGTRTYTVRTTSGDKDITVHFDDRPALGTKSPPNGGDAAVQARMLNDSVACIAILRMTGNVADAFRMAFDTLSKAPFLIIDLRRNQGGSSAYSERIARYLITERQRACVSGRWLVPEKGHFEGTLFVLTSPYTASAGESLVLDLEESGKATLIGLPTAGDTGNQPRFYHSDLGYAYWFPSRKTAQRSPKGFPMEGKSIMPDHLVSKTIADHLANKDTVLEYTLGLIGKK